MFLFRYGWRQCWHQGLADACRECINLCQAFFHGRYHRSSVLCSRFIKIPLKCCTQVIGVSVCEFWPSADLVSCPSDSSMSVFCIVLPLLSRSLSELQISFTLSTVGLFVIVNNSCDTVFTKQFLLVIDCSPIAFTSPG